MVVAVWSAGAVSCGELVERALANNLELRAVGYEIDRAAARHRGSGLRSNPEVGAEISKDGLLPRAERQYVASVSFSQAFPVTARLRLEKAVTAVAIDAARAEVADRARRLAGEVEEAFVEVQSAAAEIGLRRRQVALAEELAAFVAKRHEVGEMSLAEVLGAKLQARTVKQEIVGLRISRERQLAVLRVLVGAEPGEVIEPAGRRVLKSPETGLGKVLPRRGDFVVADLQISKSGREVALERAKKWDDLTLGISVENERTTDEPEGRGNDWFAGVGVSVPLPFWNDNRHVVEEKQAERAQAIVAREALIRRIRGELAAAQKEVGAYREMAAGELAEVRELAEQNLAEQEKQYKSGQGQLTDVLRAREQLLEL
ncbi:MAG: TolC family protein, partial [Verrucomicrobiales bacterium]|nr:TolC family protein [Verrucomicrobiales bacterium]